jgi:YD repeat-containing protein
LLQNTVPTWIRISGNLKTQWHNGRWGQGSGPQGQETYRYDRLHRLTRLDRNGNGSVTFADYAYDAIGKLTSKSDYASNYQYRANSHQLASVQVGGKTQTYTHDANGNVTARGDALALAYDIDNLPRTISQDTRVANFYTAPGG